MRRMTTQRVAAGSIVRLLAFLWIGWMTALAQRVLPPTRSHHPEIPYQSPAALGAASYAKILCSAVFVSGRDTDEARQNSAYFLMNEPDRSKAITVAVDREAKRVRVTVDNITRTAAFYGDQGCVIHPIDYDGIHFMPVPVRTALPDANSQPWPMGDAPATDPWPAKSSSRKGANNMAKRRRTIGDNPLDAVVPRGPTAADPRPSRVFHGSHPTARLR